MAVPFYVVGAKMHPSPLISYKTLARYRAFIADLEQCSRFPYTKPHECNRLEGTNILWSVSTIGSFTIEKFSGEGPTSPLGLIVVESWLIHDGTSVCLNSLF